MTRVSIFKKSLLGASVGSAALIWASTGLCQLPGVPAVPAVPEVPVPAVPDVPAVPAVDPAPAVEPVRDAVKGAADTAEGAVRDAAGAARAATQPIPGAVRDAARDVRGAAQGAARDVRDAVRAVPGSVNASANARANLRWQDLHSADLGLWFNGNANANTGLVIADVGTQGPIAKLGFQEGDRIVSVAGQPITTQANFMQYLFSSNVAGGRVPVIITRGGKQQTIYMEPQAFLGYANSYQSDPLQQIGLVADDRVQDKAVVWRVMPRTPAYYAGLRSGDIVTSFNSQPVTTAAELSQLAAKAQAGPIALEVQRGDKVRQLQVDFQGAGVQAHSALRPNLDAETPVPAAPPALDAGVRTAPATGYYNTGSSYGRRGLFRGRR
jgi:membrane-associated protease RseP (regulator of RpoE activity)